MIGIDADRGASKARPSNLPWYKRCPTDWRRGTRKHGMSMELRGFYSECLDAMWELQDQLPKDAKVLAMMLGTNPRLVRALMPKLVAMGKIVETATGYYNTRMLADVFGIPENEVHSQPGLEPIPNQSPVEAQSTSNRGPIDLQSTSKVPKNPAITTREVESESESESESYRDYPLTPKSLSADDLIADAYQRGIALKGGLVAKSRRAEQRTTGELDGSRGITFANGKLTVINGTAADLEAEFPGIDLRRVCDRAAPALAKFSHPTRDQAVAVIRQYCSYEAESAAKTRTAAPDRGSRAKAAVARLQAQRAAAQAEGASHG